MKRLGRALGLLATALAVLGILAIFVARITSGPAPGASGTHRDHILLEAAQVPLTDLLWYGLAAIAIGSAMITAFSRNIIYAGLALLGTFGAVGGMFIYLSADFLGVVQLLVYIGGILVLILFAVMLTHRIGDTDLNNPVVNRAASLGIGAGLLGLLLFVAIRMPWAARDDLGPLEPTVHKLGAALIQDYFLPFQLAAVLLLAILVGAVVIVRKARPEERQGET
jgi:NAD(P)H-quinone oxidoreductase subunit 6